MKKDKKKMQNEEILCSFAPSPKCPISNGFSSVELCAGAGGQALGLHLAGFQHKLLIEIDSPACKTLLYNNETHSLGWEEIFEGCVEYFAEHQAHKFKGVDLVAGGVPCPPFSKAGKQLGKDDERG